LVESPLTLGQPTQEELEARRAAERIGDPFLVYRDDAGRQHIFSLAERTQSITLGRREEADISIPWDPEMSRLHAELELRAGEWTVCDDGFSQNGTWVNGLRLVGRRRLADGDLLRVGRTIFQFCAPSGPSTHGPTMVPGELSATPRFSEQQQRVLRALCRPLFTDGVGINPATDEQVAEATGIPLDAVISELDHLGRAMGLEGMPHGDQRAEIALLAMRSGLVSADEGG
jgi:pSer/pThr/pTyr-binding forkhead associated (FHA) protein